MTCIEIYQEIGYIYTFITIFLYFFDNSYKGSSQTMLISVIIPVYKRTTWVPLCLEALQNADTKVDFEVIIIDDGSPNVNEFEEITQRFQDSLNINFVKSIHQGPARTRNTGIKLANGQYIAFLDDDSIIDKQWLSEIIKAFEFDPNADFVSGLTLSYDRVNAFPLLLEKSIHTGKNWATNNIVYKKDCLLQLEGFDITFPYASWEDNDLGIRAEWAGFKHVMCNTAIVYHNHEKDIDEFIKKSKTNGKGVYCYVRKYIRTKPLWAMTVPLLMARRIFLGLLPWCWGKKMNSHKIKFIWSYYSLVGFIKALKD